MTTQHHFDLRGDDPFAAIRAAGFKLPKRINMDHAEATAEGLLITLPARKIGAANGFCFNAILPEPVPWAAVSWECQFLPGFDFGRGGKFGFGLDNRKGTKTWSGGDKPGKGGGGSCRFMWREGGAVYGYTYHPDQAEKTGDYTMRPVTFYDPGPWLWFRAHMQTVGLSPEGLGHADYYRIGDAVTTPRKRFGPSLINKITCDFFRGGSTKDWAVKTPGRILVRDLRVEY